jgi:response regulator RpfG family c-di-GMP phosphodiesterase
MSVPNALLSPAEKVPERDKPVNVRAGGFARRSSREGAKTRCVLVVDDHSLFRQVLGIVLKGSASLDTVQSASVGEALRVLGNRADNDLALAIVDLDMPDMDKIALIEELRRSRVPVLAPTGSHDPCGPRGYPDRAR